LRRILPSWRHDRERVKLDRLIPLIMEASRRPFYGRVLTLGRLDFGFSYGNVRDVAKEFEVKLCEPPEITLSENPSNAKIGAISSDSYFRLLGFSESKSLDYSDRENADYIVDLNCDVPEDLVNQFDVIIDPGTLEHVFDLRNSLKNIFLMLREGGRIIHLSAPASNAIEHGFYMFSPTLFYDYYECNNFKINVLHLVKRFSRGGMLYHDFFEYEPGGLDNVDWNTDASEYHILCIATKTAQSTGTVVPQQGAYVKRWRYFDLGSNEWDPALFEDPYYCKWRPKSVLYSGKVQVIAQIVKKLPLGQHVVGLVLLFRNKRRSKQLLLRHVGRIGMEASIKE